MSEEEKKAIEIVKQIGIDTYAEGKAKAIFTVLNLIEKKQKEIAELRNKNMELKNTYIKVARHQEKIGHEELSEYMLAQIETIPTFTTWEEYYDFISKQEIQDLLENNLEKEKGEYIVDSNACQCLVRHLIELLK